MSEKDQGDGGERGGGPADDASSDTTAPHYDKRVHVQIPIGREEEDRLDRLENRAGPRAAAFRRDFLLFGLTGLVTVVLAVIAIAVWHRHH